MSATDAKDVPATEPIDPGAPDAAVGATDVAPGDSARDDLAAGGTPASGGDVHTFESFDPVGGRQTIGDGALSLLHDVEMGLTAELGRARMLVRDVLALAPGSVVELDRAAGGPVDVLVNGTLIARGEVVVIDEEFGIRITDIVGHGDES